MTCCSVKGCNQFFDEKTARRDAKRYRKRGLDGTAERMVSFLTARDLAGRSVLEVGGGVGALHLELLKRGAASARNLELSSGYDDQAAALAREAGLEGRVERRVADIVEQGDAVEEADVVVMHRVVCCHPDPDALVGAAADHARTYLVLSFPRANPLTRLGVRLANLWVRSRGIDFRAYVHSPRAIVAPAESRGFRTVLEHTGPVWQTVGLERAA